MKPLKALKVFMICGVMNTRPNTKRSSMTNILPEAVNHWMNIKMDFEYEIIRSDRKTLAIQVDSSGNVIVRSPKNVSQKRIVKFLEDKSEWIEKTIISQKEKSANIRHFTDAEIKNMRKRAKEVLPVKVAYFAEIMGVKPKSIKINSAKKRYGSCSSVNNLNFSLYLMDKDERFIDYVVVHELAHIKHHNHSRQFYDFVYEFMPDYKERSKL
ncbi:MAG: M48 family metallopeptidase [Ruminococcaceae bacterium]|nr:M48 family metallopeptidase [Oscillospiraceae bacterium]